MYFVFHEYVDRNSWKLVTYVGGVIAQLVERLNGIEEVWGSNPHGSISINLSASEAKLVWAGELFIGDQIP